MGLPARDIQLIAELFKQAGHDGRGGKERIAAIPPDLSARTRDRTFGQDHVVPLARGRGQGGGVGAGSTRRVGDGMSGSEVAALGHGWGGGERGGAHSCSSVGRSSRDHTPGNAASPERWRRGAPQAIYDRQVAGSAPGTWIFRHDPLIWALVPVSAAGRR